MDDHTIKDVVSLCDVSYRFPGGDRTVFRVPEFAVRPGEHTAVYGPSGCGKTTLLRLITGITVPERGSVRTLGVEPMLCGPSERGRMRLRSIGMVFQEFALLDYLPVLENIALTARLAGDDLRSCRDRAHELADRAGILHTVRRRPHRLSQGERQRVAVCRALVTRPQLIVCDEPTGNLDPRRSLEIIELILREADTIDATVLAVTHDRSVLGRFARSVDLGRATSLGSDRS
ncbi:MAG: ABC transporter ATP-binding protein [Planctomycetota bacterium]